MTRGKTPGLYAQETMDHVMQLLRELHATPEIDLVGDVVKSTDLTYGILYIRDDVWPCAIRKRHRSRVYVARREEDGSIRMRIHADAGMVYPIGKIEEYNIGNERCHFLRRIEEVTFD